MVEEHISSGGRRLDARVESAWHSRMVRCSGYEMTGFKQMLYIRVFAIAKIPPIINIHDEFTIINYIVYIIDYQLKVCLLLLFVSSHLKYNSRK